MSTLRGVNSEQRNKIVDGQGFIAALDQSGGSTPKALGQYGIVSGVPRHRESLGDPSDGQVLDHDRLQRPAQPTPGEPGPRFGRRGGVLAPHVLTPGAPVAAHDQLQHRRSPPEGFVSEPTNHRVTRHALTPAASAPPIRLKDSAGYHRTIGFKALTDRFKTELIEARERGQVRASEARRRSSVVHVEVFQMGGVGTSILRRPRHLSRDRRADQSYTLHCEEPDCR